MRLRLLALAVAALVATPLAGAVGQASTVPTAAQSAATQARRIPGIDVSKYQHPTGKPIDWVKVRRSGKVFAFIKATGGSNRIDPWFRREWAAAKRAGMIVGAYHYADPTRSADAQAALIVSVVGNTREANNLGIVLDLEHSSGRSATHLGRWAHAFLRGVEKRTGRVPIFYTYPSFYKSAMKSNRSLGAYPLWLARYSKGAPGPLPGWKRWTFWQSSASGRVPGIVGAVDLDSACCSMNTLRALADGRSDRITKTWKRYGGASGTLGLPLGTEVRIPGGWGQTFEGGYVAATTRGTFAVTGRVWQLYRSKGGVRGPLGVPAGPEHAIAKNVTEQRFTRARVFRSAATGTHAISGAILSRWLRDGGTGSAEGLPIAPQTATGQQFQDGGLYFGKGGVRLVPGPIRDRYEELGGAKGVLGTPVSDAQPVLGGQFVPFQIGRLTELVVAGQHVVV